MCGRSACAVLVGNQLCGWWTMMKLNLLPCFKYGGKEGIRMGQGGGKDIPVLYIVSQYNLKSIDRKTTY